MKIHDLINQQDRNYLLNQKKTILEYVSEHWMVGDSSLSLLTIGRNRKGFPVRAKGEYCRNLIQDTNESQL